MTDFGGCATGMGTENLGGVGTYHFTKSWTVNRLPRQLKEHRLKMTMDIGHHMMHDLTYWWTRGPERRNVRLVRTAPNNGDMWMELIDPKKLRKLMVIQDVSQRELALAAGWSTHSYLGRLLRGEVETLNTDPALRMAHYLGVPSDDLFLTKVSTVSGRAVHANVNRRKVAA